jgi:hypothetical protein
MKRSFAHRRHLAAGDLAETRLRGSPATAAACHLGKEIEFTKQTR